MVVGSSYRLTSVLCFSTQHYFSLLSFPHLYKREVSISLAIPIHSLQNNKSSLEYLPFTASSTQQNPYLIIYNCLSKMGQGLCDDLLLALLKNICRIAKNILYKAKHTADTPLVVSVCISCFMSEWLYVYPYAGRESILHPVVLPPGNPTGIHRDQTESIYRLEKKKFT